MQTSAPISMARATALWATLAGSRARRPGDDFDAEPVRPDGQLLDGGGAERVGRAEHDRLALAEEHLAELGDRRGLARAVDAGDHDDRRPGGGEADRVGRLGHERLELRLDRRQHVFHLRHAAAVRRANLLDRLAGGLDAHVAS